ncbi:MAG: hypothetical protein ABI175_09045 [Polyangiales bacterium]
MRRPLRRAVMTGALALIAAMVAGCPKKNDPVPPEPAKIETTGVPDAAQLDAVPPSYVHGDVLKHVPERCAFGRVYVDLQGLTDAPAIAKNLARLDDKLAEAMKGPRGDKAKEVLGLLEHAGIDPARDLRELALCADAEDDVVVAVGGDFGGKDVLGAVELLAAKEGDALEKKVAGGISYLQGKDKMLLGQLTPTLFVAARDAAVFARLAPPEDRSQAWGIGAGRLVVATGVMKKQGIDALRCEVTEKDDALALEVVVELSSAGKAAKDLDRDHGKAARREIGKVIAQAAAKLAKSPARALAADVADIRVAIDGHKVTLTMKCSNAHLGEALTALTAATESELEDLSR